MSSFKSALGQFLLGEMELAALESALADELRARPEAASEINTQLEQLYRSSRLPHQIFAVLKRQVLNGPQPVEGAAGGPAAPPEERTRFRVADDRRQPEDEHTVFMGPPTSRTGGTSQTGRSQPHDARSQPTGSSRSGSASSGWSSPSQWTGGGVAGEGEPPDVGSVIQGRFVLEQRIGQGGMGVVYKARDLRQEEAQERNPFVALKLLNEEFKRHPDSLKALQREARKAQDLAHPNVVYVSSFDRDGGNVFMVMELLDGEALDRVIKRQAGRGMPYDQVLPIVEGMVAGLGYAHKRGIVHSDFKPSNAWMTRDGTVKIFDFGIARAAKIRGGDGEKTLFDAGSLGALTPAYASVEMLLGQEPDTRDDVYALACVTYELLTGSHPFRKKPADQAQREGLKPDKVKGLSGRQYKGLLRGLAFDRKDRSPTVEDFLEGIKPYRIQTGLIASAAMAAIVLAIGLGYFLPRYLDQLEVDELAEVIGSGDATRIVQRLDDIAALDAPQRTELFARDGVTTRFIDFYRTRVESTVDPEAGTFDYVEAARLISEAKSVPTLTNDARLRDLENNTIKLFDAELTRAIDGGLLIPEQGPRNAMAIAEALRVVQPDVPALDLAPSVLKQARSASDSGDMTLAMQLVERGLEMVPGDDSLTNLRDEIRARAQALEREAQKARAETRIASALGELDRLDAFDPIRSAMDDLLELDPQSAVLADARGKLNVQVESEIERLTVVRDFAGADKLLSRYGDLLPSDAAAAMQARVTRESTAYQSKIQELLADFREAIDADRLGPPAADNAEAALAALIGAGIPDVAVEEARRTIAEAYLLQAVKARDATQWDRARQLVNRGLQQQPGVALQGQLNEELAAIDESERVARTAGEAEQQRLALEARERDIRNLTANFETTLNREEFTIRDANSLLDVIKNVQSKGGDIADGRNRIVDRIVARAGALETAGEVDGALEFLELGAALFPGTPALQSTFDRIAADRQAQLAATRDRQIAETTARLTELLSKPGFDEAGWNNEIRAEQQKLEKVLGKSDAVATESRRQIAAAYLQEAKSQRSQKRFVNAQGLLDRAKAFVPDLPGLAEERAGLDRDAIAQRESDQRAERLALIARLQQSVRAKAGAKDAAGAVSVFNELSTLLPPNDPYLVTEGPRAIAEAYLALAGDAEQAQRWDEANQLAAKALERVPNFTSARELRDRIAPRLQTRRPEVAVVPAPSSPTPAASTPGPRQPSASTSAPSAVTASTTAAPAVPTGPDPCAQSALIGNGSNPRAICRDSLGDGRNGPAMVVVPAGGPLSKPLAISKFEITIRDYNAYCQMSASCAPISVSDDTLPVTEISVQDAERLANWLSDQTRARYRLPTSAEWDWAVNAQGQVPTGDVNCLVGNPSNPSKGAMLRGVSSGQPNGWGLYNVVGNAREWAKDGSTLSARGGARTDRMDTCRPDLTVSHSGEADGVTGFRLVREIGG